MDWPLLLLVPAVRDGAPRLQAAVWNLVGGLPEGLWGSHAGEAAILVFGECEAVVIVWCLPQADLRKQYEAVQKFIRIAINVSLTSLCV